MARESPLYIEAMDPVQLHWGKESWKNSLSATSSRLAVTFLAGSAYQYFRPVFYSENTTSIPRLVGKAEKRRRRRKERKGRVDDAQRLAQQFFSTIFKSLQVCYFFSRVSNLTSKQRATIIARKGRPKKLSIFDREGKKGEGGRCTTPCTTIFLHDL